MFLLPNFLLIGAAKAGTNALHEYLRSHPEAFMPPTKELKFFSDENWCHGLDWYEAQFEGATGAKSIGEGSVQYSMYPRYTEVPARIADTLPDVRLLYLVRHPVSRILSQYRHLFALGIERDGIEKAVLRPGPRRANLPRDDNPSGYVWYSRYAAQIDRYMQHFRRDQLLVVKSEDLLQRRAPTLHGIYSFLRINPEWTAPVVERDFHVASDRRRDRALLRLMRGRPIVHRYVGRVPVSLKSATRRLYTRPAELPEMPDSLRVRVEDLVRDDVAALRSYMPAGFDGWGLA